MQQVEREKLVVAWRERWHPFVLQVLSRRLPANADIADLAQEVYLRLLRVEKLDLVRHPRAYVCRVAINIADEWRLRSTRMPMTADYDAPEAAFKANDNLEDWLSTRQDREVVRTALMSLPLNHRTALVMHVTQDLTYPEIASRMGVTRRQVKRYLAKAYANLRERVLIAGLNESVGATEASR